MTSAVYVLGGAQTDFARNWTREGLEIFDLMKHTVLEGLEATGLEPADIQTAHIGNYVGELFCKQAQLGGLFATIAPDFAGLPTARHEAACASGSIALLAAAAEIEAGRYDVACVLGAEILRNLKGRESADYLGVAKWHGHEFEEATHVWPKAFSDLMDEYQHRYGIDYRHLGRIAALNYENARRNPNAQTRTWSFNERSFLQDDEANPIVEGHVRRNDCGQLSDGGSVVFLASHRFAESYVKRAGRKLSDLAVIAGWGHRTSPIRLADKLMQSRTGPYVLPHLRQAIADAFSRAALGGVDQVDCIETHDCFAMTEYAAIDHFGITAPGQSWRAIEDGSIEFTGRIPVNPSGGLIGLGHPIGATGVRLVLDAWKQVTGKAGAYQVPDARVAATLNIGGSATTVATFVIANAA